MPTRVIVDGLGDIGSIVNFKGTELEMSLGGLPSAGVIMVKDQGVDLIDFVTGSRITVDRGPSTTPVWSGYLVKPGRRHWFDVDRPDTLNRQWRLTVADINWLFSKRVVFKLSAPNTIKGPLYTTDTYDDDVIDELVTNWLDLSADDIDVTTRVHRVGHVNAGQQFYPFNAGMQWREAMVNIAQLPAAIFGIDAARRLVYADVDDQEGPFILSDTPGSGRVGYREMQLWFDGERLINDALCWGFGKGGNAGVFERLEDATSIETHGLWQEAITSYSIWKQSTIDKVADSIVNGSPGSRRGGKNDRIWAKCATYEHGLSLGDRVRFISDRWDFDDVMPVRKMRMAFPGPDMIRYELELGHDIDRWGFQDPQPPLPGSHIVPVPIPEIPVIVIPGGETGCTDAICGITDDMAIDVATVTSTSDVDDFVDIPDYASLSGLMWTESNIITDQAGASPVTASFRVEDGVAKFRCEPSPENTYTEIFHYLPFGRQIAPPARLSVRFRVLSYDSSSTDGRGSLNFQFNGGGMHGGYFGFEWNTEGDGTGSMRLSHRLAVSPFTASFYDTQSFLFDTSEWYTLRLEFNPGDVSYAWLWADSDPEPSTPTLTATLTGLAAWRPGGYNTFLFGPQYGSTPGGSVEVWVDDLDIENVNACARSQFDDFGRSISTATNGWGSATPNGTAWVSSPVSGTTLSVASGSGRAALANGAGRSLTNAGAPVSDDITVEFAFRCSSIPNSTSNAYMQIAFEDASNSDASVLIAVSNDTSEGELTIYGDSGNASIVRTGWVVNTDYNVKWHQVAGGMNQLKVWAASVMEPSAWDVEVDNSGGAGFSGNLYVGLDNQGYATTTTISIHYIDFDYSDRPCFSESCGWSFPIDLLAKVRLRGTDNGNPAGISFMIDESVGSTSIRGLVGTQRDVGTVGVVHQEVFATGRGATGGASFATSGNGVAANAIDQWFWIRMEMTSSGVRGKIWLDGSGEPGWQTFATGSYASNAERTFGRLAITTSLGPLYYEIDSLTLNGYGLTTLVDAFSRTVGSGWGTPDFDLGEDWNTQGGTQSVGSGVGVLGPGSSGINILMPPCTEDVEPSEGGEEVPLSGPYCETLEGGGTIFPTLRPYLPGSTRVTLNGFFQRPEVDYAEAYEDSEIQFAVATDPGDTVYVCYEIA